MSQKKTVTVPLHDRYIRYMRVDAGRIQKRGRQHRLKRNPGHTPRNDASRGAHEAVTRTTGAADSYSIVKLTPGQPNATKEHKGNFCEGQAEEKAGRYSRIATREAKFFHSVGFKVRPTRDDHPSGLLADRPQVRGV